MRLHLARTVGLALSLLLLCLLLFYSALPSARNPHSAAPRSGEWVREARVRGPGRRPAEAEGPDFRQERNPIENTLHVFGAPDGYSSPPDHHRPRLTRRLVKELRKHLKAVKDPMEYCPNRQSLAERWEHKFDERYVAEESWDIYFGQMDTCSSYKKETWKSVVVPLLKDLKTKPITFANALYVGLTDTKQILTEIFGEGTQVKLKLDFEGGLRANFKPKRFNREFETDPNHFYFSDFERHNAEVASFHLDRVLELYRGVPTTLRIVDLRKEIYPVADYKLNKTFFVSPSENLCFMSKCDYYCDTTHAICGRPDKKEAMLQVWLLREDWVKRREWKSPYKRTYSKHSPTAKWQEDPDYCQNMVIELKEYANGRGLLDLMEIAVFDFLIGNQDRHHYETMIDYFKQQTFPLWLDQGRGFGRSYLDDLDILAPLTQCCLIRPAFLQRLVDIAAGDAPLSQLVRESIASVEGREHLPVLAEKHYRALDRRHYIVLHTVLDCIKKNGLDKVVMNEYSNPDVKPGEGKEIPDSDEE